MIKIGDKIIANNSNQVFIIAEAGVNHNGDIKIAKKLIDKAVKAGADAVKFQTFKVKNLLTQNAPKAEYQSKTTKSEESQYEMLKKLELSLKDHKELINYCNKKDIIFLSTPFSFKSADIIEQLDLPLFKIGSSDTNNLPLLKYIAQKDKPIILSTGMSNLGEVEEAVNTILNTGNDQLAILHCITNYPTEYENVNLKAMDTVKKAFKLPVGFSDHTLDIEIPIAAVARGASIIEKHFTLDKTMEGPDHKASLEPDQLRKMVRSIRNVEKALGDGIKKPVKSEIKNKKVSRKSLVIKKEVQAGEKIKEENLAIMRPGTGIEPKFYNKILGFKINKNLDSGYVLKWDDLKDE